MKAAVGTTLLIVVTALSAGHPLLAQSAPPSPAADPAAAPAPTISGQEEASATPGVSSTEGLDPWQERMKEYYKVRKFPKDLVVRLGPNVGYPASFMRFKMEILDEDAEWVYMRNLPIDDPESGSHNAWKMRQGVEARELRRQELAVGMFVMDPAVEYALPGFTDRLHLEEWSQGLPNQGRWQMGMALADMNGDGLQDIVLPPTRLGTRQPTVVLQTAIGWRMWQTVKWPADAKLDYGDVEVADFDRDGHLDIAIACHFLRNYVLHANGKGDFTRFVELPSANEAITSRALAMADFDGDKRQDLAVLSELDLDLGTNARKEGALLQVLLNTAQGWKALGVEGGHRDLYGDHVASGDFDGDGHPDILVSSHKNSNRNLIFVNKGNGREFEPIASPEFPYLGYVFGVAAGPVNDKPGDEALIGAFQNVRMGSDLKPMNGVVLYSLSGDAKGRTVNRQVVALDGQEFNAYITATVADLDRDGRGDLLMGRRNGEVEIYLQGLDGQFLREQSPELQLGDAYINKIAIAELGKKGERALIIESSDGKATPGSVRAFRILSGPLTRPVGTR